MTPSAPAPAAGHAFRPDIEGLRALAVLLVVACHCAVPWCRGGFVGVDVFFVLSGYLITALLLTEYRATGRIDLPAFYARRVRRLLPACLLVLLTTTAFAAVVFAPQELAATACAARWTGLYVSNLFFDLSAADYFAPRVEGNPLLHTWSLGLEEQFYLLWPLLTLLVLRRSASTRRPLQVLLAVAAVSLAFCLVATPLWPTVAFYELPARAWEFACGGVLALLPVPQTATVARRARACGVAGIGLIVAAGVFLAGGAAFPGWHALLPVSGTLAALFAGAASPRHGISRLLGVAPLRFLGSRSYAWYLWHWPCVVFAAVLFPGVGVGGKLAAAAAALVAATLTFSLVERPVRENARLRARAALALRLAGGAVLLTLAASWALLLQARQLTIDATLQSVAAAETDVAALSLRDCVSQGLSVEVRTCTFGTSDAHRTVVLFGDSHALHWFDPFRTAANREAWRLVTVLKAGCPANDVNPHRLAADVCSEWRSRAIAAIAALHPAGVVMASYTGSTIRGSGSEAPLTNEELRLGTRRTLEALRGAGVPIVVLRDTPLPPFDVPACIARRELQRLHAAASCDFDAAGALNDAAYAAERAAADGLSGVSFLDLSDVICPGSSCPAIQHGVIVYRDDNHLARGFAATLAPMVRTRLFALLPSTQ